MGIDDGPSETDTVLNLSALDLTYDITTPDHPLCMTLLTLNLINERFVREFRGDVLDVWRTTAKMTTA